MGAPIPWAQAVERPLCLLTPEMHHRALLERVFAGLGLQVRPVLETDSVLALVVAVQAGPLAAVMPGALVATVAPTPGLHVSPLTQPDLRTPIAFMTASRAAKRTARDGTGSERSANSANSEAVNRRSRMEGVRVSEVRKRSTSTASTPMPRIMPADANDRPCR